MSWRSMHLSHLENGQILQKWAWDDIHIYTYKYSSCNSLPTQRNGLSVWDIPKYWRDGIVKVWERGILLTRLLRLDLVLSTLTNWDHTDLCTYINLYLKITMNTYNIYLDNFSKEDTLVKTIKTRLFYLLGCVTSTFFLIGDGEKWKWKYHNFLL